MRAIVYIRYSDPHQRNGTSTERQLERCTAMCEARGWTIEDIRIDDGKSGYHAAHRAEGGIFNKLETETKAGVHAGKVIVIERISRMSREEANDSYELVRSITKAGTSLAFWDGDKVYGAYTKPDLLDVVELFLRAKLANEESAIKADFARYKWNIRRKNAHEGIVATENAPPWLILSPKREWIVDEQRAAIVRRIFQLADGGEGSMRITRRFNEEGIAPWPRYKNRVPTAWDRNIVARVLSNPAVIGDFQMHRMDGKNRVPIGEPVRGYYPRIVEPDLFERVCGAAEGRKRVKGGRKSVIANLVSGLAKCRDCGGSMEYKRGRPAGTVIIKNGVPQAPLKTETGSLVCRHADRKGGCENRRYIAYIGFERALLDAVLHLSMDDRAFMRADEVGRINILVADRKRDHQAAISKAKALWEGYAASQSPMAMKLAQEAEQNAATIEKALQTLEGERAKAFGAAGAAEHLTRLAALRSDLYSDDPELRRLSRLKVAGALATVIDVIRCDQSGNASVELKGDNGLISLLPGRGRRPATFMRMDRLTPKEGATGHSEARLIERLAANPSSDDLATLVKRVGRVIGG